MCEANVYWLEDSGENTLVLESVDKVVPQDDGILIESIFGERKFLKAKIVEMALVEHKILLKKA